MKISALIISVLLLNSAILWCQNSIAIKLGSTIVNFEHVGSKQDTLVFLNLHENEQTSISAIKQVLAKFYGQYFGIKSGKLRELKVLTNTQTITVDPNRIFTKKGLEKTLKNYKCYSVSNLKLMNEFADQLLKELSPAKLLVAVHNSTDGGFSIKSFAKTNAENQDTKEIYINPKHDEDDFYLVTKKTKFDYFKSKGYNVILQDNLNVEDDGSLSVYCGKNNIDYINIECQTGHLKEQIQMIEEVYKGFMNQTK